MADNEDDGPIRRAKKGATEGSPAASEAPASASAQDSVDHVHTNGSCASCTRLRAALRSARQKLRRLATENKTLREELLSAGEMIENLATDLEKPY